MSYIETKTKIDALKAQIEKHGPLTDDQKKKINYKFRLEWNFNSNSMEGNTLTVAETRSVMTGNLTVNEKPLKDVLEMRGHDEVITDILTIGKGDARLSEFRIKRIHKAIMFEDDELKKAKIGEWKEEQNMIYNHKGEKYYFATPEETKDKIHDLLNRTNAGIDAIAAGKKEAPHPIDIALEFHLEYLDIHPFYDGNGRTARILSNLLLIAQGYAPFWITEKERSVYYNYISDIQSYGGSTELFYDYVAKLVLRSQQLVLDAIEGKDLSEGDDLIKEIKLFKKQLIKNDKILSKSNEAVAKVYQESLKPLFLSLLNNLDHFDELFDKKKVSNVFDFKNEYRYTDDNELEYFDGFFDDVMYRAALADKVENTWEYTDAEHTEHIMKELEPLRQVSWIRLRIDYSGFKNDGTNTFGQSCELYVYFNEYSYVINNHGQNMGHDDFVKKLYTENLTKEETKNIVDTCVMKVFNGIKSSIKPKQ